MKKTFITMILMLALIKLNAAILQVNNSTNSPVTFTNVTDAITAANNGDTIYIAGTIYPYGNFTITKEITILGTGANPQKQLPYVSSVGEIDMTSNLSHVKISGLYITGRLLLAPGTNYLSVEYCFFSAMHIQLNNNCNNTKISGNIFYNYSQTRWRNIDGFDQCGGYYGACTNLLIENNVFNGSISGLNIPGTVIQNNIFLVNNPAFDGINVYNNGGCYTTSYISNATIQNNIFYRADPTQFTSGCTFNNNITYHPSNTFSALSGTGNLDNINPDFINFPAAGDYFGWAYNFNLQAVSPGNNAGTDGTDIGIYGGTFPVTTSGETYNMPVVRQMNITNTNVPQNGNINVKIRSTKSRTN